MNWIARRVTNRLSLDSAAMMVASAAVIGILLGILRTKLINANFNHFSSGAYFVAFKLPDFVFFTLAAGALSVAFIPALSDKIETRQKQAAWQLTSSVLNTVALVMATFSLALIIFPHQILTILAPSFSAERLEITAQIMRLVAINPLIFSISSIFSSVQQVFGRFFFMATGPLLYNLSIIASIFLLRDSMGVVGLAVGVACGALINLVFLSFGMTRLNFRHSLVIKFKDKAYRQVIKALPVRSLDQGLVYFNSIVQTRFAAQIPSIRAVTNFENAMLLYQAPITLIGMSLGRVAFPLFTRRLAQDQPRLFKQDFRQVLGLAVWLVTPVILISYFGRHYLAQIIFARDNREVAFVFGFLCLGIMFRAIYSIVSRYYYAQKDTKTTLKVTLVAIVVNFLLSWWLSQPTVWGLKGLAVTTSLVALVEISLLVTIMIRRDRQLLADGFVNKLALIGLVGLIGGLISWRLFGWWPPTPVDTTVDLIIKLSLLSGLVFSFYGGLSHWLGIGETRRILRHLKKITLKLNR